MISDILFVVMLVGLLGGLASLCVVENEKKSDREWRERLLGNTRERHHRKPKKRRR